MALGVARATTVTQPEVEEPVGAEQDAAAVVVGEGLVDGQQHRPPGGVGRRPGNGHGLQDRSAVEVGVADVERSSVG
jgi:hypothetical protein